jgi:PRTRC genetic system protein C
LSAHSRESPIKQSRKRETEREEEEEEIQMQIDRLTRLFSYTGLQLPDPDERMTPEQVRDFYASSNPEITTASIEGPDVSDGKLNFKFTRALGTKG